MASSQDLFTAVESGLGGAPVPTTASATRTTGSTTLACQALTNWPTATKVHFVTGTPTTDAEGNPIINPTTLCLWSGIVTGTNLTNLVLRDAPNYPTDPGNNINDIVQMAPDSAWAADIYSGLVEDHDTQGHHKTLHDINGNIWIGQVATASAVNYIQITNAATGGDVVISAVGSDTNINLDLSTKGNGILKLNGTALNNVKSAADANGWTKKDYGAWQVYEQTIVVNVATTSGNLSTVSTISVPVGVTNSGSLRFQVTYLGNYVGRLFGNLDDGGTYPWTSCTLYMWNSGAGSVTALGQIFLQATTI